MNLLPAMTVLVTILAMSLAGNTAPLAWGAAGEADLAYGDSGMARTFALKCPEGCSTGPGAAYADGRFVLSGRTQSWDLVLVRFDSDGQPDTSFGGDGTVIMRTSANYETMGLVVQPDGYVVETGIRWPNDLMVHRFRSDGTADASFGTAGSVKVDAVTGNPHAIGLLPDGRIIVTGAVVGWTTSFSFRMMPDGTLDRSYGDGDGFETSSAPRYFRIESMDIGRDGSTTLAGEFMPDRVDISEAALVRLTPRGRLDTSYGDNGVIRLSHEIYGDWVYGSGVLLDQRGAATFVTSRFLAKVTPAGVLDTTWGATGVAMYDRPGGYGAVRDSLGGFILAGNDGLRRYDTAGMVDAAFGAGSNPGITSIGGQLAAIDSAGRIYVWALISAVPSVNAVGRFEGYGPVDVAETRVRGVAACPRGRGECTVSVKAYRRSRWRRADYLGANLIAHRVASLEPGGSHVYFLPLNVPALQWMRNCMSTPVDVVVSVRRDGVLLRRRATHGWLRRGEVRLAKIRTR